jgi:hypothetical protein
MSVDTRSAQDVTCVSLHMHPIPVLQAILKSHRYNAILKTPPNAQQKPLDLIHQNDPVSTTHRTPHL